MTNKDSDIFFIIGGAIALIAGMFGVNYLANNQKQPQISEQQQQPKTSCSKCPFSK